MLSSRLTRGIVVLNLGGLVALLGGFLYLNQFREGLIDAHVQSLQTQGEIITAAVAASATIDTDAITIDPEKLLKLAPGESYSADGGQAATGFSLNPERIGPLLRNLVSRAPARARIYDRDGELLLDSRSLAAHPAGTAKNAAQGQNEEATPFAKLRRWLRRPGLPFYQDIGKANGKAYPEVTSALGGVAQWVVRANSKGETIISVAVPLQRFRSVRGALLLSTLGGDIDAIIATEHWAIIRIFLVSAGVLFVISLLFAKSMNRQIAEVCKTGA